MAKITAELIEPPTPTVDAIFRWYEDAKESWDSLGINVGDIGTECDRRLYYNLHWVSKPEKIKGRNARLMKTGELEEPRFDEDLRNVGVEVYGAQDRIRLVSGHVRGKRDGAGIGFLEAPKTEHLIEYKTSNDKNFKLLKKKGVREAKPEHFGQCQMGMGYFGLTRCFYLCKNKNDEDLYQERIEFDNVYYLKMLARAERLVRATSPPGRISEDPNFFGCKFCKHHAVCHEDVLPRVTCRSCLHSTAELDGDGHWSCSRWSKPLSFDEQKEACPAHLFDCALINAEQIDSDEVAETVTYRLKDGSLWVDGQVAEAA